MAVMQNCCCCGVRAGSIASAIYSLVIALLGLANFGYSLQGIAKYKEALYVAQLLDPIEYGDIDVESFVSALYAEYLFACIAQGLILIASILCIVGINQNNKGLLVPFMAAKSLGFVWYLFAFACSAYAVAKIGHEFKVIALMVLLLPFFVSDIVCLLCVLSQYQEYCDGRGRHCDQLGTTVIVQQTMPVAAGGFAYGRMQDAPPAYGHPVVTKANVI